MTIVMSEIRVFSVSEITKYIKGILQSDENLFQMWIKGEIFNYKQHSSGHVYFSLKDESSRLKCVMFRGSASMLSFSPRDGMSVLAAGSIGLYERNGEYQLYVDLMEPHGLGSLYLAYQELKAKLEKEGLFDSHIKKKLPAFPRCIGVVTSPSGAALQDIVNVSSRRFSGIDLVLAPALVQGSSAPATIVRAIKELNDKSYVDVIILARGGGSIEELWSFNDESVARAIHDSKIPVVSAIGHETDYTISDFVSDCRAPTPSAAAEIVTPDKDRLSTDIDVLGEKIALSIRSLIDNRCVEINRLANANILRRPHLMFINQSQSYDALLSRCLEGSGRYFRSKSEKFSSLKEKLNILNPDATLKRGYAIVRNKMGDIIRNCEDVKKNEEITIDVEKGSIKAEVK